MEPPASAEGLVSVFVFIFVGVVVAAVEIFEKSIVDGGFADDIFLAGPVAEVQELAAFAAEREFRDGRGVRGLFADGTTEFHTAKNTAKCRHMYPGWLREMKIEERDSSSRCALYHNGSLYWFGFGLLGGRSF